MSRPFRRVILAFVACLVIAASTTPTADQSPVDSADAAIPVMLQRDPARAAHAARVRDALSQGLSYVPGELLVKFRSDASALARLSAVRVLRVPVSSDAVRWQGDVMVLSGLSLPDTLAAVDDLQRQPEVLYAQPNYITPVFSVPNDSGYVQQWNLNAIDVPQAWDINPGAGDRVVVAVLDSGLTTISGTFAFPIWNGSAFQFFAVPMEHASDFDHLRVSVGVDLQPFGGWVTGTGAPVIFDPNGHGTHVAGTIAQHTNNTFGYAGVAHGVTLLPVKVCFNRWDAQLEAGALGTPGFVAPTFAGCATNSITDGIRYAADNGASVINLSLGGPVPQPALRDAIVYAVSRGAFVTIAAGNAALTGNPIEYPAAYGPEIDGAMTVSAVTPALTRALYSNHHPYVEIAAPGGAGQFGSGAEQIWQMGPEQSDLSFARLAPAFNRYLPMGMSGTSTSAPHVAALAALLASQGMRNPAAIEAAIKRFAKDLGAPGPDSEFGYGLVDARASLRGLGLAR